MPMDLGDVVRIIKPESSGLRLRQGVIVSVEAATVTVTIAGSTTQVAGVKCLQSCRPVAGSTCWMLTDGRDLFVLGILGPDDTGWITTAFTAVNGWTINEQKLRRVGGVVSVLLTVTSSNVTVTVPTNGNIANTVIATLGATYRPSQYQGIYSHGTGPLGSGVVFAGGDVTLSAVAPGSIIEPGFQITMGGTFLL